MNGEALITVTGSSALLRKWMRTHERLARVISQVTATVTC
jgi:hypothetical protein